MPHPAAPAGPAPGSSPPATGWWQDRALMRTAALSMALVAVALIGLQLLLLRDALEPVTHSLPWWAFALAFAATDLADFDFELERERTTFTFAEIPLVAALFLGNPLPVLAGRVIGECVVLAVHERQIPRKLLLNLSSFAAECVVAFVVFDALAPTPEATSPRSWLAALLAAAAADSTSMLAVAGAKFFHGAPVGLSALVRTNIITVTTNTSLALTALLLFDVRPLALLPLGAIVAMVLLGWHSYSALAARLDSMRLLYDFTRLVAGSQRTSDVVSPLLGRVRELLAAEFASVHLLDEGADGNVKLETWMDAAEHSLAPIPPDLRDRLVAFDRAHPRNGRQHPLDTHRKLAVELGRPHALAAVLHDGDSVIGALVVDAHRVDLGPFAAEDAKLFNTLARHIGAALENAKLIGRLREENRQRTHEARHDALTGLPNRADYDRHIADAVRDARTHDQALAVGLMDLNRFKAVNDTLGHHVGDLLLAAVAQRLRAVLEPDMFLARLGGDEFALLVPRIGRIERLTELGIALEQTILQPFELDGHTLRIGTSIGFSRYPIDGIDAASLLREADAAMYRAKSKPIGHHVEVADHDHLAIVDLDN